MKLPERNLGEFPITAKPNKITANQFWCFTKGKILL